MTLTRPQRDWLQALCELTEEHGYPPTQREWAAGSGCTQRAAHDMGIRLAWLGCVRLRPGKCRATVPLRWPSGRAFGPATAWPSTLTTGSGVELRMIEVME